MHGKTDARFNEGHLETWRREGCVVIEDFFTPEEATAVADDFVTVFGRASGANDPLVKTRAGEKGRFHPAQFKTDEAIPFDCSPALNLIGVHPSLIDFAKAALNTDRVHLYQCQAWAKFTGDADYAQPFHCDFSNHTLTVPSENMATNSLPILCYFSDVSEAHGPMHYVRRTDSEKIAGPERSLDRDPERSGALQKALSQFERSSASRAGTIIPYGIDVYHRGTNLTAPRGHRFAVMSCFKRAGNESIGYHAWAFHHLKPWSRIFDYATPEQLSCFGVPLPGDPFWTETTLSRAQARYPNWNLGPYRDAI